MRSSCKPNRGFRFPPEIVEHAVWLYHSFSLGLRDVELILAARGVAASYESLRTTDGMLGGSRMGSAAWSRKRTSRCAGSDVRHQLS